MVTAATLFLATRSFASVLELRFWDGLPLHVRRRVGPTALERHDVIDDIAHAAFWIAGLLHEVQLSPPASNCSAG